MNQQKAINSRGIQSVVIGCRVLRALESGKGAMSLKEIAAAARMPPSKARFYLVSFLKEAFVLQDPATNRYLLGPLAIQLGLAALRQSDLVELSRDAMLGLRDQTELSVFLSIWGNRGPTIVCKFEGQEHSPLSIRVGFVLPILSSATGQVFHAHLASRETDPVIKLERSGMIWTGARPMRSAAALSKVARQIKKQGYAVSDSRLNEGYTGISVPIFDSGAELAGTITVLGTSAASRSAAKRKKLIGLLSAAAREISAQLGHRDNATL